MINHGAEINTSESASEPVVPFLTYIIQHTKTTPPITNIILVDNTNASVYGNVFFMHIT